jgi:hypothetical protein
MSISISSISINSFVCFVVLVCLLLVFGFAIFLLGDMVNRFLRVAHFVFAHLKKHRNVALEMRSFFSAGRNVVLEMSLVGLGTRIKMQTSARRRCPLKSLNFRRGVHSTGSKQPEAVGRSVGRSGFGSWGWAAVVREGGAVCVGVAPTGRSQSQITCAKDFGVLLAMQHPSTLPRFPAGRCPCRTEQPPCTGSAPDRGEHPRPQRPYSGTRVGRPNPQSS